MFPLLVSILCLIGVCTSSFMLRKSILAAKGMLADASVVDEPAARLFFGLPNSLFGLIFYSILFVAIWFAGGWLAYGIVIAVLAAALTSVYLACNLVFITRMPCPFCWTSHVLNFLLFTLVSIHFLRG